jgi:hypothetical protein
MTNKLLFLVALIPLLIAPSHVFAILSTNQTSSNETNTLLKQIKVELERILVQLQAPPTLPIPPPTNPGCGLGTDNSICNVPAPPFLSSPPPFNATASGCKPQNDNGVLIYPCPTSTFPTLEQPSILPPIPAPTVPIPLPPPLTPDCINTIYGVFCPTN